MTIRVTNIAMTRTFLTDLNQIHSRMSTLQQQISSGRQLNSPHEDPFGTGQALTLEAQLKDVVQFQRNVNDAMSSIDTAETALGNVTGTMQRIRELMLQASNTSNDANALKSIAAEITQLKEAIRDSANTRYGSQYVFSGTATDTSPYPSGVNTFQGNNGAIVRRVSPGLQMQINTDGPSIFGTTTGAAPSQMNLFDLLDRVVADLNSATPVARENLRTVDLDALDGHLNNVLQQRANLGSLTKRLEVTAERLTDLDMRLRDARSRIVDTDMPKAYMELQNANTMYESALAAGSRMLRTSLLDFI